MKPSQLEWCRNHLRLGDNLVFAAMEEVKDRIKRETAQSRECLEEYFANAAKSDVRMVAFIGERRAELNKVQCPQGEDLTANQ